MVRIKEVSFALVFPNLLSYRNARVRSCFEIILTVYLRIASVKHIIFFVIRRGLRNDAEVVSMY